MALFDRITEGQRERELTQKLRSGAVTAENIESNTLPFFVKIQIQTTTRCNGRCVTCPYPTVRRQLPQGEMSEETFTRIVEQIAGRGVERTSLFLMNEPLVDRRLERFTTLLKEREPAARAVIFTNGQLLTGQRARSLAEAGMDEINVSINGFDREQYEQVMEGIDYGQVMKNLCQVGSLLQEDRLGSLRVKVVGLDLPGVREGSERFRKETGLDVYLKPVTNRAGAIDTTAWSGSTNPNAIRTVCQRPFVKAYVLYNGDLVLCNCDWMRSVVIGNVNQESLHQHWNGPRMNDIRRDLLRNEFPREFPCASCDYPYLID